MIDKNALKKISYGMYIVTSGNNTNGNGFISNTVFQVTAAPVQFAVCCNKDNYTASIIKKHKAFGISVLKQECNSDLISTFGYKSGKDVNKIEGRNFKTHLTDTPLITDDSLAILECQLINFTDVGSHLIFIGEVLFSEILSNELPLTYTYYREVKKGIAPKNAPTYIDNTKTDNQPTPETKKHKCTICGYIYDPNMGDPSLNIPEKTKFEDLPSNWKCPICGASTDDFIEL